MKVKNYLILIVILVAVFSCNTSANNKQNINNSDTDDVAVIESIKNIEVDIEGMTCEIGCARLIQSKLYKTEGVIFADISFENKLGKISFDANKLSNEDIENEIKKIAGGDLYKVIHSKEVASFSDVN